MFLRRYWRFGFLRIGIIGFGFVEEIGLRWVLKLFVRIIVFMSIISINLWREFIYFMVVKYIFFSE